jgi:putative hydrolase of the HAD superfamily
MTRFFYFDLGNVLLAFSHERMCRQMAAVAGSDPDAIRRLVLGSGLHAAEGSLQQRLERGALTVDEAFEEFCRRLDVRPDRAALYRASSDIFTPITGTIALVERLSAAGNRLGILSNTNPWDWEFVKVRYAFLNRHFETAVLSYEAGAMKPERAIFEQAIARAGVPAAEIFFVDDRPEHVAGARAAGIDAVHFTTPDALEQALAERRAAGIAPQRASP